MLRRSSLTEPPSAPLEDDFVELQNKCRTLQEQLQFANHEVSRLRVYAMQFSPYVPREAVGALNPSAVEASETKQAATAVADAKLLRAELDRATADAEAKAREMMGIQQKLEKVLPIEGRPPGLESGMSRDAVANQNGFHAATLNAAVHSWFQAIDVTDDGKITRDQLRRHFTDMSEDGFAGFWNYLDKNADGCIDYDEFYDWVTRGECSHRSSSEHLNKREQALRYIDTLSPAMVEEALSSLKKLMCLQDAERFFKHDLHEEDRKVIEHIMSACASKFDNNFADGLNAKEFNILQQAVKDLVHAENVGAFRRLKSSNSAKIRRNAVSAKIILIDELEEEFEKAIPIDRTKRVNRAGVAQWLSKIAHAQDKDKSEFFHQVAVRCAAIAEINKFEKVVDMTRTMTQYGDSLVKLKQSPDYRPIESKTVGELLQPVIGASATVDNLMDHGSQVFNLVYQIGEELRAAIGSAFWSMGPMKTRARAASKIKLDYAGNVRRLLDVVRFSIVCDNLSMMEEAINFIERHKDIDVIRIKSGFESKMEHAAASAGYRDVKLNCKHKSNGHLFEIQLHLLLFYAIKNEQGHELYKWSRQFSIQGITCAIEVLNGLSPALLDEMKIVSQLNLERAIKHRGDESAQALHARIAVAEIARLARDIPMHMTVTAKVLEQIEEHTLDWGPNKAISQRDVALVYCVSGGFGAATKQKASECLPKVISIIDSIPDKQTTDHLLQARAWMEFGSHNFGTEEGAAYFQKSMEAYKTILSEKHPLTWVTMKALGACLTALGRVDEALVILKKQDGLMTDAGVEDSLDRSDLHLELGQVCEKLSDWKQAVYHFEQSTAIRARSLGETHIRTANVLFSWGRCLASAGQTSEAQLRLNKALPMFEKRVSELESNGAEVPKRDVKTIEDIRALLLELSEKA